MSVGKCNVGAECVCDDRCAVRAIADPRRRARLLIPQVGAAAVGGGGHHHEALDRFWDLDRDAVARDAAALVQVGVGVLEELGRAADDVPRAGRWPELMRQVCALSAIVFYASRRGLASAQRVERALRAAGGR